MKFFRKKEALAESTYFGMQTNIVSGGQAVFEMSLNSALAKGWGMNPEFPWEVNMIDRGTGKGVDFFFTMMLFRDQDK